MIPSDRRKALWNIALLVLAAIFAWTVRYLGDAAADSERWNKLIFPDLGPFTGLAPLFIIGILPGLPFVFVAWRLLRTARSFRARYRIGIGCLVIVLGIVSFKDIAWMLFFVASVIHNGGKL